MIHSCPACGQKNRVPDKYKGIPVCASCKTQMFDTVMMAGKATPPTSSVSRKRSRWSRKDWHLAIPIGMLALVLYWAFNHDWSWLWAGVIDWITTIAVNMSIITAIALSWIIIGVGLKVGWEEIWGSMQQRRQHPREDEDPLLDIGPWEAAQDYLDLFRRKADDVRARFTVRKEQDHATD